MKRTLYTKYLVYVAYQYSIASSFSMEYELENGCKFTRTLFPTSTMPLTFCHEVLALRVEGLATVKHECVIDMFGTQHPVTVDLCGKENPVWAIRFQDTLDMTRGACTFLGEGFNFSRLSSPRIMFDP